MPGTIPLASSLAVGDGSRGVGDWAIEGLRLIGVDLAGRTAAAVAAAIDAHQVPKPGLYRWRGQALAPVEERLPEGTEPWLLFLHGTFSNTLGSFGALAAQSAQWRRLEADLPRPHPGARPPYADPQPDRERRGGRWRGCPTGPSCTWSATAAAG